MATGRSVWPPAWMTTLPSPSRFMHCRSLWSGLDYGHGHTVVQREGEPDIVWELAGAFAFETPPLLETLRQSVASGQPEQLKRAAHNLKGSSNNLGARTMAALSAEWETSVKNVTV